MKIIFDSSSLISISDSCLINILERMALDKGIKIIIPRGVELESVSRPINIKRFELNALRIKQGIQKGWIDVFKDYGKIKSETEEILRLSNSLFSLEGSDLQIVHRGEGETISLAKHLNSNFLAIDERTTRLLIENPKQLKKHIERKYQSKVTLNRENLEDLEEKIENLNVLRSTELVALAFEEKYFGDDLPFHKKSLEAALYAMKYHGCAISSKEIEEYLNKA